MLELYDSILCRRPSQYFFQAVRTVRTEYQKPTSGLALHHWSWSTRDGGRVLLLFLLRANLTKTCFFSIFTNTHSPLNNKVLHLLEDYVMNRPFLFMPSNDGPSAPRLATRRKNCQGSPYPHLIHSFSFSEWMSRHAKYSLSNCFTSLSCYFSSKHSRIASDLVPKLVLFVFFFSPLTNLPHLLKGCLLPGALLLFASFLALASLFSLQYQADPRSASKASHSFQTFAHSLDRIQEAAILRLAFYPAKLTDFGHSF